MSGVLLRTLGNWSEDEVRPCHGGLRSSQLPVPPNSRSAQGLGKLEPKPSPGNLLCLPGKPEDNSVSFGNRRVLSACSSSCCFSEGLAVFSLMHRGQAHPRLGFPVE